MNIAIISMTDESMGCIKRLSNNIQQIVVIEKDHKKWTENGNDITICSLDKALHGYQMHEIEYFLIPALKRGNVFHSMYLPLHEEQIPDEAILYIPYDIVYGSGVIDLRNLHPFIERNELDRLELHIIDKCNLKCANCSMFAALVDDESSIDFKRTKKALFRLKKVYNRIHEIDIFGGEPLLSPLLLEYCELVRMLYPSSQIYIVTNGTRIPQMSDILLKKLNALYIKFSITYYPSLDGVIEKAITKLNSHNIQFEVLPRRTFFLRLYDFYQNSTSADVHRHCPRKSLIIAMRERYLASCYVPFAFRYAAKKFNIPYSEECIIDLMNSELNAYTINKQFLLPLTCCKFCHDDRTEWKQANEFHLEDWSIL